MRKSSLEIALALLLVGSAFGCAPMTFSNEPTVNFSTYRSVRVQVVTSTVHTTYAQQYLVDRLVESSGFTNITADPATATDLVLEVDVSVSQEINVDDEGDVDIEYAGYARFSARTPAGVAIDSGEEEDTSESELEAVEDVLDQIEYHYFEPYRY